MKIISSCQHWFWLDFNKSVCKKNVSNRKHLDKQTLWLVLTCLLGPRSFFPVRIFPSCQRLFWIHFRGRVCKIETSYHRKCLPSWLKRVDKQTSWQFKIWLFCHRNFFPARIFPSCQRSFWILYNGTVCQKNSCHRKCLPSCLIRVDRQASGLVLTWVFFHRNLFPGKIFPSC